ncbi:MAG: ORF6N domain-containing protein [Gammaproteobacteria bacterium]|nr:ORF6N domain-containing protein [Gammaproteobacteria bacterium]
METASFPQTSRHITVAGTNLPLIEYKGQIVVTLAMIDKAHQRPDGTAKRNFNENKHNLIKDEDWYLIEFSQKDEFRTFEIEIPPRGLIVVTECGYTMIVKSFKDDLSWKVQRMLVNNYFKALNGIPKSEVGRLLEDRRRDTINHCNTYYRNEIAKKDKAWKDEYNKNQRKQARLEYKNDCLHTEIYRMEKQNSVLQAELLEFYRREVKSKKSNNGRMSREEKAGICQIHAATLNFAETARQSGRSVSSVRRAVDEMNDPAERGQS